MCFILGTEASYVDWWAKVSSLSSIHDHIQLDTLHSVGFLWTSDQLDVEPSTC